MLFKIKNKHILGQGQDGKLWQYQKVVSDPQAGFKEVEEEVGLFPAKKPNIALTIIYGYPR